MNLTHFSTHQTNFNNHYPGDATPSPEKKGYFEIQTLEWLSENSLLTNEQDERLPFYEIYYFKSASGHLIVDTIMYPVECSSIFCFVPGQVRNYFLDDDMEGYRIRFSPDFLFIGSTHLRMASWLDSYGAGARMPVIQADPELQGDLLAIIGTMQKEYMNYFLLRAEILSGLLNILIIHFSRQLQATENDFSFTKDNELVHKFKTLLKEHFITKKLVADYADELCVTPNYLNKTVKKITGFTASHHIQQEIILEAKRRAIHSNGSMKEIAYFLGFDNLAHFSKFFKNNSGMNFTSFKKGLSFSM